MGGEPYSKVLTWKEAPSQQLPSLQADVMPRWQRVQYRKKWAGNVLAMVHDAEATPREPLKRVRLECYRFTNHKCDWDNLVYSFKVLIDALQPPGGKSIRGASVILNDTDDVVIERVYKRLPTAKKDRRRRAWVCSFAARTMATPGLG